MKQVGGLTRLPLLAVAMAAALPTQGSAQENEERSIEDRLGEGGAVIEEVFAVGRLATASQQVVNERLADPAVVDMLGADTISRLGDSTVAAALRRVPGLSLVGGKFVYIRGLGERYSATSLNGAQIPSPDLTRNVIPLDIFPTSSVQALRVQKAWSPDLSANFGGGTVDIRTRGIPDQLDFAFEIGTGTNTENTGSALTYRGGSDDGLGTDDGSRALSPDLASALATYQGNVDESTVYGFLQRQDPSTTRADAAAVSRTLALQLNREIGIERKHIPPDASAKLSIGNRFAIGREWEFGFLAGTTYDQSWREVTRLARNFNFPDERTDTELESTRSVNLSGTLNLGMSYLYEHDISTTSLYFRNTDDETAVRDFFNENRQISDGLGFRNYRLQFEERNMRTNQITGSHYIGPETRDRFPGITSVLGWLPEDAHFTWFYSQSNATTDIPSQVSVTSATVTDPMTAAVLSEAVVAGSSVADYRFTDLDDDVRNSGWALTLPLEFGRSMLELKGGGSHARKARTYRQNQFGLGPLNVANPEFLRCPLDQVFSDENILNPANDFRFSRTGTNNQSYIAATMTDALFGMVDWTYDNRWRVAAGARWEDYRQVALDWNPYGFSESDPQVSADPEVLARGSFSSDEVYPAASVTYMSDWWAETFQLRFGWSETTVRPDLREITDASYVDPITNDLISGNSGVVPADVRNYDIRAEWFFAGGDNFTVTLFSKDIEQPIEFFESPASDTTIAREILNAESGWVRGAELEGMKRLGFLGGIGDTLFLQGNLTVQSSELVAGPRPSAPTNPVRSMAGASDYVANVTLGFDSRDARHAASLVYNVFGERLYVSGRNGSPDGFEQPFRSVDMTYSWYPTDGLTVKAKAQNLLGEKTRINRGGIEVFERDPGRNYALSLRWSFH